MIEFKDFDPKPTAGRIIVKYLAKEKSRLTIKEDKEYVQNVGKVLAVGKGRAMIKGDDEVPPCKVDDVVMVVGGMQYLLDDHLHVVCDFESIVAVLEPKRILMLEKN